MERYPQSGLLCCRFKTENANSLFIREFRNYVPRAGMSALYVTTLKETFAHRTNSQQSERRQTISQIDDLNTQLKNAWELVADDKLDAENYRELKKDCTVKTTILEAKLSGTS